MSEPDFDPRDPYDHLLPILAGQAPPQGTDSWEVGDGLVFYPIESHRNLWSVYMGGTDGARVVTLDADDFPTTADLGLYIEQVIDKVARDAELAREGEQQEEEPRQTERAPTYQ